MHYGENLDGIINPTPPKNKINIDMLEVYWCAC